MTLNRRSAGIFRGASKVDNDFIEIERHTKAPACGLSRLDVFFSQASKDFNYAVEIRNAGLVDPEYRQVLERHGVAHVYNHWSYMPPLSQQHQRMESFTAPFTVLRLLTPLKMSYEVAKKRTEPYHKIVGELPEMRRDTVELVKKAMKKQRRACKLPPPRSRFSQ